MKDVNEELEKSWKCWNSWKSKVIELKDLGLRAGRSRWRTGKASLENSKNKVKKLEEQR